MSKVDWACEHAKELKAEIDRYIGDEPHEVMVDQHPDTLSLAVTVLQRIPIPLAIPYLIGDCIQNLRSSLDYLVWELVLCSKNTPKKRSQFPICDTPEGFQGQVSRHRLDGVPPDAVAEIERLQPYHSTPPSRHFLFVLNELANINKHRRPLVTKLNPVSGMAEFSSDGRVLVEESLAIGDKAAPPAIGPTPSHLGQVVEVKVKTETVSYIGFDEGAIKGVEVCHCLGILGRQIAMGIIPAFEKFLK
jgi:hypothetical protein